MRFVGKGIILRAVSRLGQACTSVLPTSLILDYLDAVTTRRRWRGVDKARARGGLSIPGMSSHTTAEFAAQLVQRYVWT